MLKVVFLLATEHTLLHMFLCIMAPNSVSGRPAWLCFFRISVQFECGTAVEHA